MPEILVDRTKKEKSGFYTHRLLITFSLLLIFILFFLILMSSHHVWTSNEIQSTPGISHERIKETISDLQSMHERRSWQSQLNTSRYLQSRLEGLGLTPQVQNYEHNGQNWQNVSVIFPGKNPKNARILAVAHYDSTNSSGAESAPGADDNASGVAVLLELANILQSQTLSKSVQLAFFSNEEHGRPGSKAFAHNLRNQGVDVRGVINVDIVGYNDPTAILSTQVFKILTGPFSLTRKGKMLTKMAMNFMTYLIESSKPLKVMTRHEDRYLIPTKFPAPTDTYIPKRFVKWVVGGNCV